MSEKSKDVEKRTEEKEGKTKGRKKTEDAMQKNEVLKVKDHIRPVCFILTVTVALLNL